LAELSLEAFAAEAGITTVDAAIRIHRARQALRKQLALVLRQLRLRLINSISLFYCDSAKD
jgi:hypothetical protein